MTQFRDYLGGNYTIYQQSLTQMIEDLHSAADTPEDQPDIPGPSFGPSLARPTSERRGRGRPRKSIDPTQLETLSRSRNTREAVGIIFECSGRTIRRRLVDLGLSPAGQPVCQTQQLQDGSYVQEYHPGVSSDLSQLSDNDLDILIQNIHTQFPSFGRRMIDGYLLQMGQRVPRRRINQSYSRLFGPSNRHFGQRRIPRAPYNVPGPNRLWHHDGQHGKVVVHHAIVIFSD